jgi:hypothetical protein
MKTIEEFRDFKLEILGGMLKRPHMYMVSEDVVMYWLDDMAYIDDRPDGWEAERDRLRTQGRFASTGVKGGLQNLLARNRLNESRFFNGQSEVMSVYAEVICRLGYLNLHRRLTAEEWQSLISALNRFKVGDWHQADVVNIVGPPSTRVNSKILCYAGPDHDAPWICFDFEFYGRGYPNFDYQKGGNPPTIDGNPEHDHPDSRDPLLQDVRFQGRREPELIITEYGKRIQAHG